MFERIRASLSIRRYPWQELSCAACGDTQGEVLLARDRYLLRVNVKVCAGCGLIYTGRNLNRAALDSFYRDEYRRFYEDIERISPAYIHDNRDKLKACYRLARIRERVGTITGVVEIGSGLGFFIRECRQGGIDNVLGFEPCKLSADYAASQSGLAGKIIDADYRRYDGKLPQANVYALFHVLEHLPDPGELLTWIGDRIGNGWLVIEVPDIAHGWERLGLVNFHFGHRHYFSIGSLAPLLQRHGFGVLAFDTDIDDGIYPGNLRVFARRLDVPDIKFAALPAEYNREICRKVRNVAKSPWRNGLPRCAARLLRP